MVTVQHISMQRASLVHACRLHVCTAPRLRQLTTAFIAIVDDRCNNRLTVIVVVCATTEAPMTCNCHY